MTGRRKRERREPRKGETKCITCRGAGGYARYDGAAQTIVGNQTCWRCKGSGVQRIGDR